MEAPTVGHMQKQRRREENELPWQGQEQAQPPGVLGAGRLWRTCAPGPCLSSKGGSRRQRGTRLAPPVSPRQLVGGVDRGTSVHQTRSGEFQPPWLRRAPRTAFGAFYYPRLPTSRGGESCHPLDLTDEEPLGLPTFAQ